MTVPVEDLRSLPAIRERCQQVYLKGQQGQLCYFDVDESKLEPIIDHVVRTTKERYPALDIPPHGRLRHFDADTLAELQHGWKTSQVDAKEQTRRLLDLVVVSVLVDAGAGDRWKYQSRNGKPPLGRSEGLAAASLDMFVDGTFSSTEQPHQADSQGLQRLSTETLQVGMQVTDENPMVGLEGRAELLRRLGQALDDHPAFFGSPTGSGCSRPGYLVDHVANQATVSINDIWEAVMSLETIWPIRSKDGTLGDVWPCTCLDQKRVPFHKLSQWLTYSLVDVLETTLGTKVDGIEHMTGLPEYRNGGLLVDYGLLTLKPVELQRGTAASGSSVPEFDSSDPVVVEWRALTVIYLDKIHEGVQKKIGKTLTLTQVLEGGTWTAGREIAAQRRPGQGTPPIGIRSDGTVF